MNNNQYFNAIGETEISDLSKFRLESRRRDPPILLVSSRTTGTAVVVG